MSLGGGHQTMLSSWTRSPAPKRCADIDVVVTDAKAREIAALAALRKACARVIVA